MSAISEPRTVEQIALEVEALRSRLREAEETLRAIGRGELDAIVLTGSGGGIEILRLHTLADEMSEAVVTLDHDGAIRYCNRRFCDRLQTTPDAAVGRPLREFIDPSDHGGLVHLLEVGKFGRSSGDVTPRRGDGSTVPFRLSFARMEIGRGSTVAVLMDQTQVRKRTSELLTARAELEELIRDRTASLESARSELEAAHAALLNMMEDAVASSEALRESNEGLRSEIAQRQKAEEEVRSLNAGLEARVRVRTAQLEAANRELEAFSYSVSHDLRAPLRAIEGFAAILRERLDGLVDDESRHLLQRIGKATIRMAELIEALLSLSRVGRKSLRIEDVDLGVLAREIADELREGEPSRAVRFVVGDGLRVRGDAALLRGVLENLLRNAWKFTAKREQAVVELGRAETEGGPEIFVRDNGAGFDNRYAANLFAPFQRLHAASDFPGTGIGLAIVRRAIATHGGSVRADGTPGVGATFFFTLPAETEPGTGGPS